MKSLLPFLLTISLLLTSCAAPARVGAQPCFLPPSSAAGITASGVGFTKPAKPADFYDNYDYAAYAENLRLLMSGGLKDLICVGFGEHPDPKVVEESGIPDESDRSSFWMVPFYTLDPQYSDIELYFDNKLDCALPDSAANNVLSSARCCSGDFLGIFVGKDTVDKIYGVLGTPDVFELTRAGEDADETGDTYSAYYSDKIKLYITLDPDTKVITGITCLEG